MRQAEIYRKDILAGVLAEDGGEYRFRYEEEYLARKDAHPVSLTLPLQTEAFVSPVLFPFFDGLIPEGWLLDVAIRNTDISILDRMSLLLLCCKECIGAISVVPLPQKKTVPAVTAGTNSFCLTFRCSEDTHRGPRARRS